MPRSRLGPLAVESKLGDYPAESSVWRAIHVQLQRAIAVKLFTAPFGGTQESRAQFAAEWELLKSLQHPAIVRCYGGGFENGDAYLAHELIQGETLAAQLARLTKLSWEGVLDLAEPLADALEYLHGKQIVHGAVCPDKIMIAGLSPVLIDVRLNRFTSPYRTARPLTAAEVAMRAPELVDHADQLTPQADLYALGATLYLALTGQPPIDGSSLEEVKGNLQFQTPLAPAKIVLDCPVWLDKLILQMLDKNPAARPPSATAVKLALGEVRRRSMSRATVAEHASAGFSALKVTNQQERDEARSLLGRELVDLDAEEKTSPDATLWHDQAWVLIGIMVLMIAVLAYVAWPDSEDSLRHQAEALLAQETRSALTDAKLHPLRELLVRFPDGQHALWAREQIDRIDVMLFLHQLSVKIKNNLVINNQGEMLHKQAQQYAAIGDISKALDKYRSITTVLGGDPEYTVAVNAANYQISVLEKSAEGASEASRIVQRRLDEAEQLLAENRIVAARQIWYSLVELYGGNSDLAPLIARAQGRLRENSSDRREQDSP